MRIVGVYGWGVLFIGEGARIEGLPANGLYPWEILSYPREIDLYPRKERFYPRMKLLHPRKNELYPRTRIFKS